MAAKEEAEVGAGAARTVVGLALCGSKSSADVLPWALANFAKDDALPAFKLIHVLTPVLAVPTPPMGHLLPIGEASTNVAEGHLEKQEMLRRCKDTCDENKVEAQVLLVEGKDVADTISSLVSQYQIQFLVVGTHSRKNPFTRSRTTCKICKSVPSFCTAYVVSEYGGSSFYASGSAGQNSEKGNLALLKRRKLLAKKSGIQLQHVSILEDIFRRVTKSDVNRVTACSNLFLRVALSPCICIGSRVEPRLVAVFVESKRGSLRSAVPVGTSTPWLESAFRMLNSFFAVFPVSWMDQGS